MNPNVADDNIARKLFNSAMKGEWNDVVEIIQRYPTACAAKITRSGETALHLAVRNIQEDLVAQLVNIKYINVEGALEVRNERGNSALHIAASLGSVRICRCIAEVNSSLIGAHNLDKETPLFLAALNGKKDAFLCLNSYVDTKERGYSYCRRKDGQTILHCAITGHYFDLAFQIIHLYERLVNSVDEHGLSPLHILASKPSVFRSGSRLGLLNGIIYNSIIVDDLKFDLYFHGSAKIPKEMQIMNHPVNYETCIHFLKLLKRLVQTVFESSRTIEDEENPQRYSLNPQRHRLLPPNYQTCFDFAKLVSKAVPIVLALGFGRITELIKEKKRKHTWSVQIMHELLLRASFYEYEDDGSNTQPPLLDHHERQPYAILRGGCVIFAKDSFLEPNLLPDITGENPESILEEESQNEGVSVKKTETPILIAAKYGITEMVEKILEVCPVAIHDLNSEKKNLVQLAVENRQPHVYQLLLRQPVIKDSMLQAVDENGNNILHLAAMFGDGRLVIPRYALEMQLEISWFEFVKNSLPPHFLVKDNKHGKTPRDVFTESHQELVEKSGKWLTKTSESCSVVAALIATVAFATTAAVPGGTKEGSGKPNLESHPAFNLYAISSLIALCSSIIAVIVFQAIRTSQYLVMDFEKDLPRKLLFGLTSMFVSIASILVSFCAGHFFVFRDKLKYAALPVYTVTCVLVTLFAVVQFPLYFDLAWVAFKKVPQRSITFGL